MNATETLTLDGTSNATLGFQIVSQRSRPLLPRTWDMTERVPNRHGQFDYGANLRERKFELDCCAVDCTTQAQLAAFRKTLAAFLVDDDGNPRDMELVFDDDSTRTYTVRVSGEIDVERAAGGTLGYFRLNLVAYDPHAYGEEVEDTDTLTTSPQLVYLNNAGTVSTPLLITLINNSGAVVLNPVLTLRVEIT